MINPSFKEYLPSYYVSTANPHPSYPTLEGRLKTETCVIGGGLTGLCTALPLAENGHEVIVLEAARIGFGASGRSGGQVISDFACGMEEIENKSAWNRHNGSGSNPCKPLNWLTRAFKNTTSNAIGNAATLPSPSVLSIGKNCNNGTNTPKNIMAQAITSFGIKPR